MPVSEQLYLQIAAEDPEGKWELYCGELHRKPPMTSEHEDVTVYLGVQLATQLARDQYRVRIANSRVRRAADRYYIPDVMVTHAETVRAQRGTRALEVLREPLLFVAEVWSPSTGGVDQTLKLQEYRARGDLEIWLLHPFDHTVTRWVRQADGTYEHTTLTTGGVHLRHLPGVVIDLDALWSE